MRTREHRFKQAMAAPSAPLPAARSGSAD